MKVITRVVCAVRSTSEGISVLEEVEVAYYYDRILFGEMHAKERLIPLTNAGVSSSAPVVDRRIVGWTLEIFRLQASKS